MSPEYYALIGRGVTGRLSGGRNKERGRGIKKIEIEWGRRQIENGKNLRRMKHQNVLFLFQF